MGGSQPFKKLGDTRIALRRRPRSKLRSGRLIVGSFLDLEKAGTVGACHERMPRIARGLIAQILAACADDVACKKASGFIESHDVKAAAHDERELRFAAVPMGAEVGLPVCHDEEALDTVIRGHVDVMVRASPRARRRLDREFIKKCA